MRSSWTFSRKLALGFVVRRVIGEMEVEARTLLDARQTPREPEAGAPRTVQTSSQSTSPTSLTRLVQTT